MPPVKKYASASAPPVTVKTDAVGADAEAAAEDETQPLPGRQESDRAGGTFAILQNVKSEVVGREREVREIFAAMLSRKHILLEGPPGTSKSTIVRAIARSMRVPFYFIEGSIDLTPSKLLGFFNPGKVQIGRAHV